MEQGPSVQASFLAEIPGFGKYFFMGDGPGNTSDRDGQDEKPVDRLRNSHGCCNAISLPQGDVNYTIVRQVCIIIIGRNSGIFIAWRDIPVKNGAVVLRPLTRIGTSYHEP